LQLTSRDADSLIDAFAATDGFEIGIAWADSTTPVGCIFLRVNDVVIDHDHLLRRPQGYRLPLPKDGLYAVDWGLAPQAPLSGVLSIGIVNRATGAKVVVGSVSNQQRDEWASDNVVRAP
jgi:hypothetical protein